MSVCPRRSVYMLLPCGAVLQHPAALGVITDPRARWSVARMVTSALVTCVTPPQRVPFVALAVLICFVIFRSSSVDSVGLPRGIPRPVCRRVLSLFTCRAHLVLEP